MTGKPPANNPPPVAAKSPGMAVLAEPRDDTYVEYGLDPRLEKRFGAALTAFPEQNPHTGILQKLVQETPDEQSLYDEWRLYKRRVIADIQRLEEHPLQNRPEILTRLSELAVALLLSVYDYAGRSLHAKFGHPHYLTSYQSLEPTELAVVSMGKLGAREINYESDLDLIFIYSHIGETRGQRVITNGEYYAKFAQRLISMLSVQTGAGRLYEIDVELRPSGNAGALVSSADHFLDHQMNRAQYWERQALLRAHTDVASKAFTAFLQHHFDELCYERPLPLDFFSQMHLIRERVLNEKAHEKQECIDLKLGPGGIMDIEFIVHAVQLRFGTVHRVLRERSLFRLFAHLRTLNFFSATELETLSQAYCLFRTVESLLQLTQKRSVATVDCTLEAFGTVATRLNYPSAGPLKEALIEARVAVRKLYQEIYVGKRFT